MYVLLCSYFSHFHSPNHTILVACRMIILLGKRCCGTTILAGCCRDDDDFERMMENFCFDLFLCCSVCDDCCDSELFVLVFRRITSPKKSSVLLNNSFLTRGGTHFACALGNNDEEENKYKRERERQRSIV